MACHFLKFSFGKRSVFTPSADDAVVAYTEIQTKLAESGGNVQIITTRSGGTKAGSIIVNNIS